MTIRALDEATIKQAVKLAAKVFPYRGVTVRLSFWAYQHQGGPLVRRLMRLAGYETPMHYWVALDENNEVVGTTGIYSLKKDEAEAVWMAWFCVDPGRRGQGIGKELVEHSIAMARARGKRYFRLYTSTLPCEAAAQGLYEKYHFRITEKKNRLFYHLLYRELALE